MNDSDIERDQRVTPLELFFDLVFAFAITQVTTFLSHNQSLLGLFKAVLLLGALWWAWSAYAWLTNALDPEEGAVRVAVLAAVAAMLVVALATPRAFGASGALFGAGYLVVRAIHLGLFAAAGRNRPHLMRSIVKVLSTSAVGPVLLVAAGFVTGAAQLALWVAALAVLYLGPLIGHMSGWSVSPDHFVERYGLIVMIALGESIVAIGAGASRHPLTGGVVAAALLGMTVAACLWWSYFDWFVYAARARLTQVTGTTRAVLARDAFSYLHLPMVGGIVLFAFGLKTTMEAVHRPLPALAASSLVGGVAAYLVAHVALRVRIGGGLGRGRPAASAMLLVLLPAAPFLPALAALSLVAAIGVALIAYEFLAHRHSRAWIRQRRGAYTTGEMEEFAAAVGRDRMPGALRTGRTEAEQAGSA